jgi:hypothetical protein
MVKLFVHHPRSAEDSGRQWRRLFQGRVQDELHGSLSLFLALRPLVNRIASAD